MCASKGGHTEVVEILLQHGGSVDLQKEVSTGSTILTSSMGCFIASTIYLKSV